MRTATALLVLHLLLPAQSPALDASDEFRPPTSEELARIRWKPRSCVNFLEHLRAAREKEPALATEAEALALLNDGPEANARLVSALGRLPASDDEVDWEATFTRYMLGDAKTLNPIFRNTSYDGYVVDLLYSQPFNIDWNLEIHGDLNVLKSWETSEDGLIDRVVLRDDLTWSDGKPFTAHDIVFSHGVLLDGRVAATTWREIAGGLQAVVAVDDRTVLYFQKEALATNRLHLAFPVLPAHAFQATRQADPTLQTSPEHVRFNTASPVTNGPYKLVSWTPRQEIVLERRDEWHRGPDGRALRPKPFFRRVRLRVIPAPETAFLEFQAGNLDDVQLDTDRWVNHARGEAFDSRSVKLRADQWAYAYIGWNAQSIPPNPFFADQRVRRALSLALDLDFYHQSILFGIPLRGRGIFHPSSWMATKDLKPIERDVALAEELLDEAGWKDSDGDGIRDKAIAGVITPFRFRLSVPNAGSGPRAAETFQANWKAIGVDCVIKLGESTVINQETLERRAQAFLMVQVTGADPDTIRNLWQTQAIQSGRNTVGYSNPRVDELLEQGRRETDPAKRAAIYSEVERRIHDDQAITVLFYQPSLWGFGKHLRGYRPSPRGWYTYLPGFFSVWKKKAK
jgi:peptide/nickel transport system substrate-binding protein